MTIPMANLERHFDNRMVQAFAPGSSTAIGLNTTYRLARVQALGVLRGEWLDYGCAEGGYTAALVQRGAARAVGCDTIAERISEARRTHASNPAVSFVVAPQNEPLPFPDASFDGVFMNEVLEHVTDEEFSLSELHRVLRPAGVLVVISPNRGFPFEGHGAIVGTRVLRFPVPILPWLPKAVGQRFMQARNYWPEELRRIVAARGFEVDAPRFIWPVLDLYRWLPGGMRQWYQSRITIFDQMPLVRRLGVSVFVVGRKRDQ
jgi:SAM-dependent methyltransferase